MSLAQNPHRSSHPVPTGEAAAGQRKRGDSGYAYIMALFMVLTVIIGSQVVLRNMVTVSRSQREAQAIWRGNQYARAIKMYYRKTGHFPTSQDDLVTGVPGMHFLRSEVMKDPMNNQDGAWRFIYTNASGAIIGSVKYGSMQQMALMDMNGGQMPSTQQSNANGSTNGLMGLGASTASTANNSNSTNSTNGGFSLPTMGGTSTTAPGRGGSTLGPLGQPVTGTTTLGPAPTGPVSGPVFGGQLVGVGSTVDKTSVRVYKGGTKYNEWEFIWNPIEEQARAVQQGLGGVTGAPGAGGIPGLGLPIAPIGGAPGPTAPGGSANPTSGPSGNSNTPGDANSPAGSNNNPSNPTQ